MNSKRRTIFFKFTIGIQINYILFHASTADLIEWNSFDLIESIEYRPMDEKMALHRKQTHFSILKRFFWWISGVYRLKRWLLSSVINLNHFFFRIYLQTMRRREIQSFTLKLSDLKEYETVRQERLDTKAQQNRAESAGVTPESPMKLPKWGPKSKQEIRERIGLKS